MTEPSCKHSTIPYRTLDEDPPRRIWICTWCGDAFRQLHDFTLAPYDYTIREEP